jgi:hypothetical protein
MLRDQEVNQFAVSEAIRLQSELDAARESAAKWCRIANSGSRCMLSMGAVLGVAILGLVTVVILWLRAAAAVKGGC